MYIDTSKPRKNGDIAIFESPYLTPTPHCLSLWYNMYGRDINKLQVNLFSSTGFTPQTLLKIFSIFQDHTRSRRVSENNKRNCW